MFSNTGNLSFFMYLALIVIAFAGLGIAIKYLKNNEIPIERLDKIIDLSKYTIVTIAVDTITIIVTDLYKEGEQDVKDLEYFDKYVNDVKDANNVSGRYQLAKYLASVAPSGEMQKSWKNYFDTVSKEYQVYINDLVTIDTQKKLIVQIRC